MTLLMNPMALRMGLLLFAAIAAFRVGLIHDSAPAEESPLGIRLAEFLSLGARGIARARLSRRHPATETAKA